jgi:enoyl-CoA hydratase/carnithine racemase
LGLINRIANVEQFDSGVSELVNELTSKSGSVLRLTLKGLREQSCAGFDQALKRSEEIYCHELLQTEDVEEGVSAFLQKRAAKWRHR